MKDERLQHAYDGNSNRLYRNNLARFDMSELYHANGAGTNTAYNLLDRLTHFRRGELTAVGSTRLNTIATASRTQNWSLDVLGNWKTLAQTSTGGQQDTGSYDWAHDAQNKFTNQGVPNRILIASFPELRRYGFGRREGRLAELVRILEKPDVMGLPPVGAASVLRWQRTGHGSWIEAVLRPTP